MSKKICLVDGSGYIFRAFYGLPPMTNADGTPVNAVYGFTNMIMKLASKFDCDYNLVLFDAQRRNFRNEIFPEYKATRKEIPEDLIPQFPIIREAAEALQINHLEQEGYEADDLIATYTDLALGQGLEVIIVSADKDLMQLIREGVTFYDPMKDKFITPDDVKEKFGVFPDKVPDVQALSGDSTDNVPGVPGIGPKTAAELVNCFGSLAGVLANAEQIKQNKRRETLLANIENARISLQLVTLKSDVPVVHQLEDYIARCPDLAVVENFADKYGFVSLKSRMARWVDSQCAKSGHKIVPQPPVNYQTISDSRELQKWLSQVTNRQLLAIKILADGDNPHFSKPYGIALAIAEGEAVYVPLRSADKHNNDLDLFGENRSADEGLTPSELSQCLSGLLNSADILKIGHNLKLDMHLWSQINPQDKIYPYDDVEVMSYVVDSTSHDHSLMEMAGLFLDIKMQNPDVVWGIGRQKKTVNQIDGVILGNYGSEQADMILRLYNFLRSRLVKEHIATVYEQYDRPLVATLYQIEKNGIVVDAKALLDLSRGFEEQKQHLEDAIYALAGEKFNLGSPKQIGEILYNKLGLSGKKRNGGNFRTDADVLEQLAESHPLPAKILEWRAISKLKSTYTDTLLAMTDAQGRIHTTFDQTNVNTGRLSSNNPNLQNIPVRSENGKKIRSCFVAQSGYKLISADYSQVELRLLAAVADVKSLKKAFAQGIDVHKATAEKVFAVSGSEVTPEMRRHAKAINFGVVYGISQYGLAKQIGITPAEAKKYIDAYFADMPEIKIFMENTIEFARKHGYVTTPFGRKCTINGINEKNQKIASFAERAAMNAPLQGGAADIMKRAMNNMQKTLIEGGYKSKILVQVHDEMVVEAPDEEVEIMQSLLKKTMESAVDYDVKFEVEVGVGDNWTQAH